MSEDRPERASQPDPGRVSGSAQASGTGSVRLLRSATFSRKLAFAFAIVAALTAAFAAALISFAWNAEFDRYLRDDLQQFANGVAHIAEQAYPTHGGWSVATLFMVPRVGAMRGIGVQILDEDDKLIYDDTTTETQLLTMDARAVDENEGQVFVLEPRGPVVTAPVEVAGSQVGTVRVWAYGPGAVLTERDQQFRSTSFRALGIAALVAIALASLAGMVYATRLVRPIERITATARELRGGRSEARTGFRGDDEIAVLGRTLDEMADAIEADRELERRLTADVAHELRTPLQAIQATVEAMQDGVLPADEERLGTVRDETVRLGRLADAILELTRLERGTLPFEMGRLDLSVPVRAAVDSHEALFEAAGLTLSANVASGLMVTGDPDRLQQAVSNLLSNAARYTPEGGRVGVSMSVSGRDVVIDVEDSGIGVSEEDLPHLFSRFWRADDARARSTGGLGIGLAVTKEIVERHGGHIRVERIVEGGSRFSIAIPLA